MPSPKPGLRLLAILASVAAPSARASPWFWLSPTPGGFAVNAVAFPTASAGFLVGAQGTILATTDGGQTWQTQTAPTSVDLYGVFFLPDAQTGWVVGTGGTILHTSDGGATWTAQSSPTTHTLYAVVFTDAQHGFCAGEEEALLQTADGGATWTGRDGLLLSVNALAFPDAQHGFAAGWGGNVLLTIDGGNSWSEVFTGMTDDILALSFADADHGWAVGESGTIAATSDGGHSWQLQGSGLTGEDLVGVAAVSPTVAYAVGASGAFYFTVDGASWQTGLWPSADTLTSLAFAPGGVLWVGAASGHVYRAAAATPGTQTFQDQNQGFGLGVTVAGLAFADPQHGVFATGSGLFYTTNGGTALAPGDLPPPTVISRPTPVWQAVAMPTSTLAVAVGTGGGVAVSHDGGQTWTWASDSASFTTSNLYAVFFLDSQHGWIAGASGLVLSTTNGGQSWIPTTVPGALDLHAVYFADASHGFVGGDYGVLAQSSDGVTWTAANVQFVGNSIRAIGGVLPGSLYAVGTSGYVLTSPDEGASWYAEAGPANGDLNGVWFVDPLDGFLVTGKPGEILVTHDGGNSWTVQLTGVPSLSGVAFADALHGFTGGAAGSLLGTVTAGEPACGTSADCASVATVSEGFACTDGACTACNLDTSCGPTCSACSGVTPFCVGDYCGQCRTTADCTDGGVCLFGGCVVNIPVPDDGGGYPPDAGNPGQGGRDGGRGVVTVLPDGGIEINPGAACGCRPGGGSAPWAALAPLLLLAWLGARRRSTARGG
ncbi:MAG TPA: YCF48-related protein [Myxococcales bacterium]|nr:YCF48-related protein [Myxococcales bacterium]